MTCGTCWITYIGPASFLPGQTFALDELIKEQGPIGNIHMSMVYASQSIAAMMKAIKEFSTSNERVRRALGERNPTLEAKNAALDAKNTTLGALEMANVQLNNTKRRVEELTTAVMGMDAELTTHNNRVTSLEADVEGKETALQERDKQSASRASSSKRKMMRSPVSKP